MKRSEVVRMVMASLVFSCLLTVISLGVYYFGVLKPEQKAQREYLQSYGQIDQQLSYLGKVRSLIVAITTTNLTSPAAAQSMDNSLSELELTLEQDNPSEIPLTTLQTALGLSRKRFSLSRKLFEFNPEGYLLDEDQEIDQARLEETINGIQAIQSNLDSDNTNTAIEQQLSQYIESLESAEIAPINSAHQLIQSQATDYVLEPLRQEPVVTLIEQINQEIETLTVERESL